MRTSDRVLGDAPPTRSRPGVCGTTIAHGPLSQEIAESASHWNGIVDLAILLEPVVWPNITGRSTWPAGLGQEELREGRSQYRQRVLAVIQSLDPNGWRDIHQSLRFDAAGLDGNHELYLLLRVANWDGR